VFEKSWEFTVGNGTTHRGFVNKALERGEEYIIFQRAMTKDNEVSRLTQFACEFMKKICIFTAGERFKDESSSQLRAKLKSRCE